MLSQTDQKCNGLFSPGLESRKKHVLDSARSRKGFGMADRFLYVRTEARLAACQPNLGPAEHDHHAAFAKMNQMPCPSVLKTLNIAKED